MDGLARGGAPQASLSGTGVRGGNGRPGGWTGILNRHTVTPRDWRGGRSVSNRHRHRTGDGWSVGFRPRGSRVVTM